MQNILLLSISIPVLSVECVLVAILKHSNVQDNRVFTSGSQTNQALNNPLHGQ